MCKLHVLIRFVLIAATAYVLGHRGTGCLEDVLTMDLVLEPNSGGALTITVGYTLTGGLYDYPPSGLPTV